MSRVKFDETLEERIEGREYYFKEKADKLLKEADSTFKSAFDMSKQIPMGQPILIGHHSEKADRRFRARIDNKMRAGSLLFDKAKYYQERTVSNAIHSLDEKADEKIEAKIERLMKQVDAAKAAGHRSNDYRRANPMAEIRRLKKRLEIIKLQDARPIFTFKTDTVEAIEEGGRVNVYFNEIPSEEVRTKLKRIAMKWSPTRKCWTRQITTSTSSYFFTQLREVLNG